MRPCIFIPGITGSTLENVYPMTPQNTWLSITTPLTLDRLALDAMGQADLDPTVLNRPRQVVSETYGGMVQGLRGRLGGPVFTFPYDWRLSSTINARMLAEFVRLLQIKSFPDASGEGPRAFDFVCHSMGGIIFRNFLRAWGTDSPLPVNRVVFVGTPHQGSLEAIQVMVRGGVLLFPGLKAIRKLARGFPGVYELLPRLPDAVKRDGTSLDIFDASNWQSNVTEPSPGREDVEQGRLDAAKAVLDQLPHPLEPRYGLRGRVLIVYGDKEASTLRHLPVLAQNAGVRNWFDFEHGVSANGDQLVPVESAMLPGVPYVRIPFDRISLFDDLKVRLLSFHSFLTELDEVQTVIARFLAGEGGVDLLPLNLKALGPGTVGVCP